MKKQREGHIPIPPWAWIIVGVIMTIYSKTVQIKSGATGMILFFYLGIGLTIFGLGKLFFNKKKEDINKNLRKQRAQYNRQMQQNPQQIQQQVQQQQRQAQHQQQKQQPTQHNIILCPGCGGQNYSTSSFCHRCGARLK